MGAVVTLTMNPALDLSTAVGEIKPFRKLRCGAVRRDPGGGGINVARVTCRLGGQALAVFPYGGPAGQALESLVEKEGVAVRAVPIAGETREDFTVFETTTNNQFRFVAPGPALSDAECNACLAAFLNAAATSDFAVVSGSLPPGMPDSFFGRVAREARARGIRLVLDTTGEGLKEALREGVAIVKPNQHEFAGLAGIRSPDAAALAGAARGFVAQGRVEAVAITLAEQGAILVTRELALKAAAPAVEAVSTVGAGDSFLGAFLWSLSRKPDWREAFRLAVAAGSAALLSPGTDLAHAEAIHRLAAEVVVGDLA